MALRITREAQGGIVECCWLSHGPVLYQVLEGDLFVGKGERCLVRGAPMVVPRSLTNMEL